MMSLFQAEVLRLGLFSRAAMQMCCISTFVQAFVLSGDHAWTVAQKSSQVCMFLHTCKQHRYRVALRSGCDLCCAHVVRRLCADCARVMLHSVVVFSHILGLAWVFCSFSFMLGIVYHFRFATEMYVCEAVLLKFCHSRCAGKRRAEDGCNIGSLAFGCNKMDCDTAGSKKARYKEVSNEMRSMLVMVGWMKGMVEKGISFL